MCTHVCTVIHTQLFSSFPLPRLPPVPESMFECQALSFDSLQHVNFFATMWTWSSANIFSSHTLFSYTHTHRVETEIQSRAHAQTKLKNHTIEKNFFSLSLTHTQPVVSRYYLCEGRYICYLQVCHNPGFMHERLYSLVLARCHHLRLPVNRAPDLSEYHLRYNVVCSHRENPHVF